VIPRAGPTHWEAFRGEDVPEFDAVGVMVSPSGAGGVYAALVCTGFGDEWGFRVAGPSSDPDAFPFDDASASHTLTVEAGNSAWRLDKGLVQYIAGQPAVHFDDNDSDVLEIVGVFSLSASSIKLTLTDDGGEARAWTITPANVDTAASQLFAFCYGG
jgi:hypothetical protein